MKRLYSATLSEAASIAASNADPNESRAGQRLLLYSLLIVSAYLFAGVAVYTLMSGMTVLDAVYFSMGEICDCFFLRSGSDGKG